jgi:hypothetical protein
MYKCFKTLSLLCSLSCIAGQTQAMEKETDNNDRRWGIRLNLPSVSVISEDNEVFTISIPKTTGLEGEINVPILHIVNFPEIDPLSISNFLKIQTNELSR